MIKSDKDSEKLWINFQEWKAMRELIKEKERELIPIHMWWMCNLV